MLRKGGARVGVFYLLIGCVFLCNPSVHVIDVLPDVFGYVFLLAGVRKLADLNADLADAQRRFRALAWISLLKFALMLFCATFDDSMKLLLSFTFGVAELIYLLPAFDGLFGGIAYLEIRLTSHRTRFSPERAVKKNGAADVTRFADGLRGFEVYAQKRDDDPTLYEEDIVFAGGTERVCLAERGFLSSDKNYRGYTLDSEQARSLSLWFFIVRAACTVIPELTALFYKDSGYVEANPVMASSRVRHVLLVAFVLVGLVFGAIWLWRMVTYFSAFRRDKAFVAALGEKFAAEVLPNDLLWTTRKIKNFSALCVAALFFLFSFRMDSYYLVPEFVYGILLLIAVRAAGSFAPNRGRARLWSICYIVSSLCAYVGLFLYADAFGASDFAYMEDKFLPRYLGYLIPFAVSMIFFVLIAFEKGKVYDKMAEKCVFFYRDLVGSAHRTGILEGIRRKIRSHTAWEVIYAPLSIGLMALLPYTGLRDLLGLCWAIRMALTAALLIKTLSLHNSLDNELEKIS